MWFSGWDKSDTHYEQSFIPMYQPKNYVYIYAVLRL